MKQRRPVNWPAHGDPTAFRRYVLVRAILVTTMLLGACVAALLVEPSRAAAALPLALGAGALAAVWLHGAARGAARRREVVRSFAGLAVVHLGQRYRVEDAPMLGEYPTRRHAAAAALDRGRWAVMVRAWDRYYLLAAMPVSASDVDAAASTAVSFRTRAVADVVPATRDDAAIA